MSDMYCWKCSSNVDFLGKITFRSICEACGASLHTCKQCKHYAPGKPNDCNIPGTDSIVDREQANFCEDFESRQEKGASTYIKPSDIEKRLFGGQ
ncbi:MAG: hypothetical protein P4L16_04700 [Chlamydiales bacterium]|nr:hypothetical protein [Chlamydiales bacterium]